MYNTLDWYDLDGTLFGSPNEPPHWPESKWFYGIHSLSPPYVPKIPGPEWWNERVVSQARQSIADPTTFSVMATGRWEAVFGVRVRSLLAAKHLAFNQVLLNPGMDTAEWKGDLITQLALRLRVDTVRIWDDREHHLVHFHKVLAGLNTAAAKLFHVTDTEHPDALSVGMVKRVARQWVIRNP